MRSSLCKINIFRPRLYSYILIYGVYHRNSDIKNHFKPPAKERVNLFSCVIRYLKPCAISFEISTNYKLEN